MLYQARKGFAIVLDLASSSKPQIDWSEDTLLKFFNGVLRDFSTRLAKTIRSFENVDGDRPVHHALTTGDGLALLVNGAIAGVELCLQMQEVADEYAPRFQSWVASEGPVQRAASTSKDPFAFSCGIGMAHGLYFGFEGEYLFDGFDLLGKNTGPAFVFASRIEAKARPGKAVLSPLFDASVVRELVVEDHLKTQGFELFRVGEYLLNSKGKEETMILDRHERPEEETRVLYSAVRTDSPFVEVARNYGKAISLLADGNYSDAAGVLTAVQNLLDQLARMVPDESIAYRRWLEASRYLESKAQAFGFGF